MRWHKDDVNIGNASIYNSSKDFLCTREVAIATFPAESVIDSTYNK